MQNLVSAGPPRRRFGDSVLAAALALFAYGTLFQIVEMLVQVPRQLVKFGREALADLEPADRLREYAQRVSLELGLHFGTVECCADRRLDRSRCGRLVRMDVPHRLCQVEQVGFVERTFVTAGEDTSARQRRRRAEECRALWRVVRHGMPLREFPALLLDPDLTSDPELTLAPYGHRESLPEARINLRCRHKCVQARPGSAARVCQGSLAVPRLDDSGIGTSTYVCGVVHLNWRECFLPRPDSLVSFGESLRVFAAP